MMDHFLPCLRLPNYELTRYHSRMHAFNCTDIMGRDYFYENRDRGLWTSFRGNLLVLMKFMRTIARPVRFWLDESHTLDPSTRRLQPGTGKPSIWQAGYSSYGCLAGNECRKVEQRPQFKLAECQTAPRPPVQNEQQKPDPSADRTLLFLKSHELCTHRDGGSVHTQRR